MLMAERSSKLPDYVPDGEAARLLRLERDRQDVARMQWEAAMRMPEEPDAELVRALDRLEGRA